jgi:hypothetical protein
VKTKSIFFKKLVTVGLSAMLMLSLGMTAFAVREGKTPEGDDAAVPTLAITKELQMPEGTTTPEGTATFTFEAMGRKTEPDGTLDNTGPTPVISDVEIPFTTDDTGATTNGITKVVKESEDILDGFDANAFGKVGYYVYKVTEKAEGFTLADGETMDYSQAVYEVTFSVFDNANGAPGEKYFAGVAVHEKNNDAGAEVTGDATKRDGAATEDKSGNGFRFVNTFVRRIIVPDPDNPDAKVDRGLIIEKIVAGELGDKTAYFPFMVEVNNPTVMTKNYKGVYRAYFLVKDAQGAWQYASEAEAEEAKSGASFDVGKGGYYTDFEDGISQNINLKHNMRLVFTDIAAGATYSAMEDASVVQDDGYTLTLDHVVNGVAQEGDDLFVKIAKIGEKANSATFTNTKSATALTGILIDNLPYIALIGFAVCGLVLFVVAKKRKARRSSAQ